MKDQDRASAKDGAPGPRTACRWPIVLGIDPGTRAVGYGAIVAAGKGPRALAWGTLRSDVATSVPERLGWIRGELDRLLEKLRPDVVVVEQAFAARNVQSALRIGEGRGVVLACAAAFGAKIVQFPPAVAKKALVGNGAADKTQVAKMVAHLLSLAEPPEPLDATDALALALAHLQRRPLVARPSRSRGGSAALRAAIAGLPVARATRAAPRRSASASMNVRPASTPDE